MRFLVFTTCLSALLYAFVTGSDVPCQNQGGTCQEDSNACAGAYHTGLCSGAATRRCCVPASGSDAPCHNQGGTCQADSIACAGAYHTGLCAGAVHRRCCVPTSGSDAPCHNQGGTCQTDTNACSGAYHTGLCAGEVHRRCCVPASSSDSCPHIISRAEWGARAAKSYSGNMPAPAKYVFIHHGASAACQDKASCISQLKGYQNYHMDGHGWSDIGYSFVVGEDGHAYMARGWTEIGAHTLNYNSVGIGICVIGNFNDRVPNDAALNKIKQLIQCGLDNGHISKSYTLKGHRDVGSTECPGTKLYNLIHSWPHYASGTTLYG